GGRNDLRAERPQPQPARDPRAGGVRDRHARRHRRRARPRRGRPRRHSSIPPVEPRGRPDRLAARSGGERRARGDPQPRRLHSHLRRAARRGEGDRRSSDRGPPVQPACAGGFPAAELRGVRRPRHHRWLRRPRLSARAGRRLASL
ncbi:MAG: 3-dehydroquinate dehydratase II, partial [uncultured Sphingomonadaceae bacterium]